MVDVAVDGLGVTGGCGARLGTGVEQVLELAARDVAVFRVPLVSGVPCDVFQGDVYAADEVE